MIKSEIYVHLLFLIMYSTTLAHRWLAIIRPMLDERPVTIGMTMLAQRTVYQPMLAQRHCAIWGMD